MFLKHHPDDPNDPLDFTMTCYPGLPGPTLRAPGLKYLGYWDTIPGMELPWPGDYVDLDWDPGIRDMVIKYLESAPFPPNTEWWRGEAPCRLCSAQIGYRDHIDGTYVWPEGFSHYLREHGVRPPEEFVRHVFREGFVRHVRRDSV